jgi:hypothetical protein
VKVSVVCRLIGTGIGQTPLISEEWVVGSNPLPTLSPWVVTVKTNLDYGTSLGHTWIGIMAVII